MQASETPNQVSNTANPSVNNSNPNRASSAATAGHGSNATNNVTDSSNTPGATAKRRRKRGGAKNKANPIQQQQQQQGTANVTEGTQPNAESHSNEGAVQSGPSENHNGTNTTKSRRNRGRNRNKQSQQDATTTNEANNAESGQATGPNVNGTGTASKPRRNRGRGKNKNKQIQNGEGNTDDAETQQSRQKQQEGQGRSKGRKRYPWRRFIPPGTVDPITLENLISMEYPPFALVADKPYVPVPIWPIPTDNEERKDNQPNNFRKKEVDFEELNRQRLQEQWGDRITNPQSSNQGDNKDKNGKPEEIDLSKRHYNLYDGRALAYYIVSELQFIDPLNRRDLTRPELMNLDAYLRRHGFNDLNVTDAYDAKGITLSSAGAVANTAQGRADILQQMARNLLNSLFSGQSVSQPAPAAVQQAPQQTLAQEQYAAMQRAEAQAHSYQRQPLPARAPPANQGVSAREPNMTGFVIIDDDENPGMRDGNYQAHRMAPGGSSFPYSGSHIVGRGGNTPSTEAEAFPELSAAVGVTPSSGAESKMGQTAAVNQTQISAAKPSKTLSRITGAVKKTDPKEQQRQWEAREAARKRAMLASMPPAGGSLALSNTQEQQPSVLVGSLKPTPAAMEITNEKLERNKALAEALGVRPATVRQNIKNGWARPTSTKVGLDDFGNELAVTVFPDSLIVQAKENMGLLIKLEKKWKMFLQDDKSASLPLTPMNRAARALVHQYAEYWNLKTESFDPEPRRYIHCVKTLSTYMPQPLLSEATRTWRGPTPQIVPPPERTALPGRILPDPVGQEPQENFTTIVPEGRERPKLELAKRTVPLDLPPFEPPGKALAESEAELEQLRARQAERARRERIALEKKKRALQAAFDSDSDDDGNGNRKGYVSDESEWEEVAPLYQSDSEM